MPWSNQSGGGGSGGNGGGPWGPRNQGPWGQGPQRNPGGPPDLEDLLRRGQDRLKGIFPGGQNGGPGVRTILLAALGAIALWLLTGFYQVGPTQVGINLVFGKYVGQTGEGLRYNFPWPIGQVLRPDVTGRRTIEIGMRTTDISRTRMQQRPVTEEGLMLTGDENIVDISFEVQWVVNKAQAQDYVFNLQNPDGTIRVVAESAMREVVGRRNIQAILTSDRAAIQEDVRQLMQNTLNSYGAGVIVVQVNLIRVDPPQQVIDAFRDVQAARQDQDRMRNEAETYASRIVPEARGKAIGVVQQAEGYRERSVNDAEGQAARFNSVYEQYRKAPAIIRERMYLETMENVLKDSDKVIIDQKGGQGVVPYLPLDQLQRRSGAAADGEAAR
ncbi:FtsH protease activity modulator HflK [Camelimonas lactis]|uniref:Protein HflK n=1 Tax=Camelimonas lactis TaxID=659006 RepID=A0A4R2GLQ9_9HYPH|nr:FtsH protease activity modulator HflK [Camelimonas lactis]TCO09989.1 membrane protease subunit HflK [Camelimonas lactis]